MAVQKSLVTKHGVVLPTAYIRIDEQSGNKENVSLRVRVYASFENCQSGCEWLEENVHNFVPSIEENSPNFIKQGYEHIKTLQQFADSIDV